MAIVEDSTITNAARSDAVEAFLIKEGIAAGVVKEVRHTTPRNPNKWGKTLAPWFTEECREAKRAYIGVVRKEGRVSAAAGDALGVYRQAC